MSLLSKSIFVLSLFFIFSNNVSYAACTPTATAGDDTVTCTGVINSFQFLYGGSDTITLNNVSAITYANSYWLDESLGGNPITDGDDTFIAHDSQFNWVLGFGGDDRFEIYNSAFRNVYGDTNPGHGLSQRGNDTFVIENSIQTGWILGGNDNDMMTIKDSNVSFIATGYSDIYGGTDFTPFDGNDTIVLDHVNFTSTNYFYTTTPGALGTGKADDTIDFIHGGIVFSVTGGHGNDVINIYDGVIFKPCTFTHDTGNDVACGIYGDEPYVVEPNATAIPLLHGDDEINIHDANISGILVSGGDGSDKVVIDTPVILTDTTIDGGDDRSAIDTFVDALYFNQWNGELKGTNLRHWEQVILDNSSVITFADKNLSTGYESGIDTQSQLPYGLILQNDAILQQTHDFTIEGNLHNDAMIDMQDGNAQGTILSVSNNYTTNGGEIYLDVTFNDASISLADILHVQGDTNGTTTLYLENINGQGAQTPTGDNEGILVVEVNGNSNASFVLDKVYEVGAFKYSLHKGSNGNWYLQSEEQIPSLTLTKEVNASSISSPGTLGYTFTVTNTGNVALSHIVITDTLGQATLSSGDTNADEILDINESWIYTLEYEVIQTQIDQGIDIINTASVTSEQGASARASAVTKISWIHAQTNVDNLLVSTYSPHQGNVSINDKRGSCKPSQAKWELVTPASHGDVILSMDGAYAYTPHADYNGNDQFTYKITFPEPCPSSNVSTVFVKVDCATTQNTDSGAIWKGISMFIILLGQGLLGLYFLAKERKHRNL